MDRPRQDLASGLSSNKKNKKKKKNKNPDTEDRVHSAEPGSSGRSVDKGSFLPPGKGGGNPGRVFSPSSSDAGPQGRQLVVNVDRGNRNVSHVKMPHSAPVHNSEGAPHKQGNQESNANNSANNSREKGKPRVVKKANKFNKDKPQEPAPSHKGSFSNLENEGLLRQLAEHRIFELKKKNPSFPNAKYFCRLCEYHLDRPLDCERHVDENRHQRKKEALDMEGLLENLPVPSRQQIQALDVIVNSVVKQQGLSPLELQHRHDLVAGLQTFLRKSREDITLTVYGSTLTGVCLRDSSVDVDVTGKGPAPALLMAVFNILQNKGAPQYKAESDFSAIVPVVRVTDRQTNCRVVFTINGQTAVLTSSLLQLYSLADPRVKQLAVTLKSWAKICHLDRPDEGTMPPIAFHMMVVYFLIHTQPPVLPLLPVAKSSTDNKGNATIKMEDKVDFDSLRSQVEVWQTNNKRSVGELWLQLLKFYCLEFDNTQFVVSLMQAQPLTRQEKKWNSKKLAIEDPFLPKKNITNSLSSNLIFEYYQSCMRKAYEYFGMPRNKDGTVTICLDSLRALASQKTEVLLKEHQDPAPTPEKDREGKGGSEKNGELKERGGKGKHGKEIKEEKDGEESTSELENSVDHPVVIESNKSILLKLKAVSSKETTPEKDGVSGESSAPEIDVPTTEMSQMSGITTESSEVSTSFRDDCADSSLALSASDQTTDSMATTSLDMTTDSTSECYFTASEMEMTQGSAVDASFLSAADKSVIDGSFADASEQASGDRVETPEEASAAINTVTEGVSKLSVREEDDQPWYTFSEDVFTKGKGPAVICGYCEQEGHVKWDCPEDKLPSVTPLPHMTSQHIGVLETVIGKVIYDFAPNENHVRLRRRVVVDLEKFVQQIYPDAQFSLFGSSCNGFGFHSSDLDICMTFRGKTVEDINVTDVIEKVAKKLNQKGRLYNVIPIPTAKVPIVKFVDRDTRLDGDISLYNTLAQRNTRLLWCYSEIDRRVKMLGYAVKVFAKVCDIGDASRGSLSSYGYILMMLHYLQQCRPPLIPVLQELHPKGERPEHMVEGCNTWFFEDLRRLPQVWGGCGKNRQGLGELWLGFLCYYLEMFDWKTRVVTIRQSAPLSKFEKMWNSDIIALEDPFDQTHNLGGGLSRKMNNYIYKTFVQGRIHFGTPFHLKQDLIQRYSNPSEYFFDVKLLTDGKPPNDRGCRMCGKIGHLVKDCPNRSQNRKQHQNDKKPNKNNDTESPSQKKDGKGQTTPQAKSHESRQTNGQTKSAKPEQRSTRNNEDGDSKKIASSQPKGSQKDSKVRSTDETGNQEEGNKRKKEPTNKQQMDKQTDRRSDRQADRQGDRQADRQADIEADRKANMEESVKSNVRPKVVENSSILNKKEQSHPAQISSKAVTTAVTTPSHSLWTTAADTGTTLTPSSCISSTTLTPAGCSTPIKQSASKGGVLPSPLTSTPVQSSGPPPGLQMDVQKLFTMAQKLAHDPVSLPGERKQTAPSSPIPPPPHHLPLTPEQQVAMLSAQTPLHVKMQQGASPQTPFHTPPMSGKPHPGGSPQTLFSASPLSGKHQPGGSPQAPFPASPGSGKPQHGPSPQTQFHATPEFGKSQTGGSPLTLFNASPVAGNHQQEASPQSTFHAAPGSGKAQQGWSPQTPFNSSPGSGNHQPGRSPQTPFSASPVAGKLQQGPSPQFPSHAAPESNKAQPGGSVQPLGVSPQPHMTPLSLAALFQSQPPVSRPPGFASPPQSGSLPVMSLFSPQGQASSTSSTSASERVNSSAAMQSALSSSMPQDMGRVGATRSGQQAGEGGERGVFTQQGQPYMPSGSSPFLFHAPTMSPQQQHMQQQQFHQGPSHLQLQKTQQQFLHNLIEGIHAHNQPAASPPGQAQLDRQAGEGVRYHSPAAALQHMLQPAWSATSSQSLNETETSQQQKSQPISIPPRSSPERPWLPSPPGFPAQEFTQRSPFHAGTGTQPPWAPAPAMSPFSPPMSPQVEGGDVAGCPVMHASHMKNSPTISFTPPHPMEHQMMAVSMKHAALSSARPFTQHSQPTSSPSHVPQSLASTPPHVMQQPSFVPAPSQSMFQQSAQGGMGQGVYPQGPPSGTPEPSNQPQSDWSQSLQHMSADSTGSPAPPFPGQQGMGMMMAQRSQPVGRPPMVSGQASNWPHPLPSLDAGFSGQFHSHQQPLQQSHHLQQYQMSAAPHGMDRADHTMQGHADTTLSTTPRQL